MPASFQFARADGGPELYNGVATLGQTTIAVQTTLVAGTTEVNASMAVVNPAAGSTALRLPLNAATGSAIVVANVGTTTALIFPPWNSVTNAAAGGRIYGAAVAIPGANASVSLATNRTATFYAHPNGIDYTVVWGAIA